jgi:hypothetical protein
MNYPAASGRGIKPKAAQLTTDHTEHTEKSSLRR